jgi:hypothetical protein
MKAVPWDRLEVWPIATQCVQCTRTQGCEARVVGGEEESLPDSLWFY